MRQFSEKMRTPTSAMPDPIINSKVKNQMQNCNFSLLNAEGIAKKVTVRVYLVKEKFV